MQALQHERIIPLALRRCTVRSALWHPRYSGQIIHQLATLLQAGLPLAEGLELLAQQQTGAQWQALLRTLAQDLAQGISLSSALERWPQAFPPLYLAMIRTGELTGKLDLCCFHLARQQREQLQLSEKVKKALRYPLIILTLAVFVVLAMVTLVLPEFAAIYKTFNTPLPLLTQAVMGLAALVQAHILTLLALLVAMVVIACKLRRHPRWQYVLLHVPVMGTLMRGQKLGQIFTVLSLTQQAGIAFLQGVESVEETVESGYWQEKLREIRSDIEQGMPVWSSFQKASVFTPLCIQLIRTGEVSGSLDVMLMNLARHHTEQTFQQADNLAALLEPLLLVVTGLIIGTLVVAMYLPIFHLGDAMSAG